MAIDRQQLYDGSRDLLDRLADRLERHLETYRSLHDVGEPIYMLNVLCADLTKSKIPVSPEERDLLAVLIGDLRIRAGDYPYLDDPARILAALHVVP
ncbi:hypothetical protein [Nonomuraea typhae]|uniref:hypothetical protein n=1 Tax=Nonomuraea typhae TaxID=2603600 RepID=UPI0012F91D02|nr:hypothetical protein [Nonomuraea typhae]